MGLNTRWFPNGTPSEQKKDIEAAIRASTTLTHQFLVILDQMEEELSRSELSPEKMAGDWAFKQAFVNGQRKQIRTIRELFNFYNG